MEEAWELAALIMASRPKIPAPMQRAIKEEAGYRCAIPTCRDKGPFDFEHIEEWSKVKKHEEHNLILLCVSCHARVTRKEISKSAIRTYKRNLAITNGRYSLIEMRLLERFIETKGSQATTPILITETQKLNLSGLVRDKLIRLIELQANTAELRNVEGMLDGIEEGKRPAAAITFKGLSRKEAEPFVLNWMRAVQGQPSHLVNVTPNGVKFINDIFAGQEID